MNNLPERLVTLTQAHSNFIQICQQLDPQKYNQPGVCGTWSPKDTVAHLIGWDKSLLQFITDIDNFIPPYDPDLFNEQSVQQRKQLSWADVMQEMEINFPELQQAIQTVTPEMKIYERVFNWIAGRTEDYVLHSGQLAAWVA